LSGTKQLITGVTVNAVQFLRKRIGPSHIVDGEPVDITLFVTELHRFSDCDYDNDNRSAIASLTTKAPRAANLYLKQPWRLAAGRRCSLDREGLRYSPTVFRQVQPRLYQAALAQAVHFLTPGPHRPLVDLYCGTGSSLAHWRHHGSPCLGIERDAAAVRWARLNHPGQPILQGRCGDRLPQVRDWLTESNAPAAVFANPPRTGLEPAVGAWLRQDRRCHRLAYRSCSPGTLGRDLQGLTQAGWAVETIHPYDFFPQTHHVETLALVSRTDAI